ncbi:MAG TPA: hypothetical protein VMW46_07370 [Candidatus Desulfaltia sp.]|nr:hypothetical protein [Candidatus Desulfaltia sp.]
MAEKFKPIGPKDLKGDQKAKVDFCETDWRDNPVVKNWHGFWLEWLNWLYGNQYSAYIAATGQVEDMTPFVQREQKNVYNRQLPVVRQLWGQIIYAHSFFIAPNTTEPEDIKAARLGSMAIEHTNTCSERRFRQKINLAKLWALILGQAFWKEWWNRDLVGFHVDASGKIAPDQGDVDFDFVNPFNVRPDPLALGRDGWRYFIEGKRVPASSLEQEFGLDKGKLPPDPLAKDWYQPNITGKMTPPKEDSVIRMELWERASPGYEKGRFMVMGAGWLFHDGVNVNPPGPDKKPQIGYFQIPGVLPILNDQWYDSVIRITQAAQRQLNKLQSIVDEYIDHFKPKAMIPRNSLIGEELRAFTRAGVEYVIFNQMGGGNPYWVNPPPIPDSIIMKIGQLEREIETAANMREVSFAKLPKYASRASAQLFRGLKEQDEVVLTPQLDEVDANLSAAHKFRLQLIQDHYDTKRMIKTVGKNKQTLIDAFEGAELNDNTDVRVRSGVDLFSNRQQKEEIVMTFVEKGLIKDPKEALELLDRKDMEEFIEEQFIDERQAERENEMMKQGKTYPDVSMEHDEHAIHYPKHNLVRKSDEFGSWSEKSQGWLLEHLNKHQEALNAPSAGKGAGKTETPQTATAPAAPGEIPAYIMAELANEAGTPEGGGI